MKFIAVVNEKVDGDSLFYDKHPYSDCNFQRPLDLNSPCYILVSLVESISTNEAAEDAVPDAHIETDARQNDMGLILLALFVPWQLLQDRFEAYHATPSNFEEFCWQIWLDLSVELEEHARFHADNMPTISFR